MPTRRLVFLGTPEMSVPPLRAVHGAGHSIELVVTGADRRRGRGSETSPSPVKAAALELGIPVSHDVDDVIGSGAELGVVVAFGKLIKPHVLAAVPMINLHFSLLPRWRGAAPVERALLAGDDVTGVCVMDVVEALDAGDVYARAEVPIGPRATADDLRRSLVEVGSSLLVDVLAAPLPTPEPQVGESTYAKKFSSDEFRLDWTDTGVQLDRWVRVGGAHTTFRDKRLGIVAAEPLDGIAGEPGCLVDPAAGVVATGDGGLRLNSVQPSGKVPMDWGAFANGVRPTAGERFG